MAKIDSPFFVVSSSCQAGSASQGTVLISMCMLMCTPLQDIAEAV